MQEKVFFDNGNGVKLCGILEDSGGPSESILIYCHGFTSSKDGNSAPKLSKEMAKQSLAFFRFDFFGHGESEGAFADITISEGVNDIHKAIDFVKSKGYKNIFLMGTSYGGQTSLLCASERSDIKALGLLCPVINYKEKGFAGKGRVSLEQWKEQGYTPYVTGSGKKLQLNYSYYEDAITHDGYEAAKKISIPVLIVHGKEDEQVSYTQSEKASEIMENCRLELVDGADHCWTNPQLFEKALTSLTSFIVGHSQSL